MESFVKSALSVPFLLSLVACVAAPATEVVRAELAVGETLIYRAGQRVPPSQLVPLGAPASLGGTVLAGDPQLSARIDLVEAGGVVAGVFQATPGIVDIHFPFTEHATILHGRVELTDETGQRRTLGPGDSYLISQGSTIRWEVADTPVQKAFFQRTEAADHPGPMLVYPRGVRTADEQLVDLGPPEGLGGTVVDGDPAISARIDLARDGLVGGVFQATRGEVLIDFPFTEHATIARGVVTLTDENGCAHTLEPGDGYLVRRGSQIGWDVDPRRVQKSFLNFAEP